MLTKTITYTDYNGVERTEDHFFNLTKADIMEMELSVSGGLAEHLRRIIAAKDTPAIVKEFKDLIIKSYGVKSPDGKRFIKNREMTEEFMQTEAFSQLFMELATDDKAASMFVQGIIPSEMQKELLAETSQPV